MAFITTFNDIETAQFAQLASSVIIIFDHGITLDEEVELIWKSSWSMGKALFIICLANVFRALSHSVNNYAYFSSTSHTDSVSFHFFHWQAWTSLIACMIAEVILQMRIYALFSLDKRVLALMVTMFVISSATSAAIMGTVLSRVTVPSQLETSTCTPVNVSVHFFTFWIPIIIFESFLCALALFRGFQIFRRSASVSLYRSGKHLMPVLIRDSVLYFLVLFAAYFTCLLIWACARGSLLQVPIAFSLAMSCCLGNRLVLNARDVKRDAASAASAAGEPPLVVKHVDQMRPSV
ncbi:hypothetical protein GGX14DRAFT_467697 [Mycena pura]|uniref:DUF6533 domain-containing protein n=1 Tax=Mycena pura TaxID=153505 RepID=A0AAD6V131_9AGAR|nr:hypothetical protein GGX14DRAFT_467697 [Mycena pura]